MAMIKNQAYVYKWVRKSTGEFYVGVHNGDNPNYVGNGTIFKCKYYNCPDDWERESVIYCNTYKEALELEAMVVDAELLKNPLCLNIKTGGQNGRHSEQTKKRISNTMKNVPKTEAHKKNMKKPKSLEHSMKAGLSKRIKVRCIETNMVFASVGIAAEWAGLDKKNHNIGRAVRQQKTAGGYHWEYVNEN